MRASIRLRLTAWYAAALFIAFSAAAFGLRQAVGLALRDEYRTALTNSAEFVQTFFGFEASEYPSVEATADHLVEELVFPAHEVGILRPDGTRVTTRRVRHQTTLDLTGPTRSVELPLDSALAPGWRVRVSSSTASLDRPLARIDLWLAAAIAVGVVGAAAGGWWLAGRALRPIGAMAAATDRITTAGQGERLPVENPHDELGRLGTRVNALLDRLDAALAQQRQFLADAAHELRTPIARMRSRVDLALQPTTEQHTDAHVALDALVAIERDLVRTSELVDELLQLARADAGVRRPALVPAFLDDVVMDVVQAWHATIQQRGLRLDVEAMEEAPARLDPLLVERLVGVLLDNASRYTPPCGRVAVLVRREADAAVLEIRDSGIGMDDADRARAFERFFRGERARALVPDGSGLGLPIAAWVAEVHEATLTLAPSENGGTVARVVFPPVAGTAPTPAEHRRAHGAAPERSSGARSISATSSTS
jgi:signal transduction histidine kinase